MKHKKYYIIAFIAAFTAAFSFESCYYDKEDYLYPNTGSTCDTTNVTYTSKIKAMMDESCATTGCHNATTHASGIYLDTYDHTKAAAQDASFLCTIKHESGCSPMPKNMAQFSDCKIRVLEIWAAANYPN